MELNKRAVTSLAVGLFASLFYFKARKTPRTNEGQHDEAVSSDVSVARIYIYPVKSCAPVQVTTSKFLKRGFQYDRRWMVVDRKTMTSVHSKVYATFPQIQPEIDEKTETVTLTAPGCEPLVIPFAIGTKEAEKYTLLRDDVHGVDVGDEAANWFSNFLGVEVRLVQLPFDKPREIIQPTAQFIMTDYELSRIEQHNQTSLAHLGPLLVISEESLKELNTRTPHVIKEQQFRPSIVLKGGKPYQEDHFGVVKIGQHLFKTMGNCVRCHVTTIDVEHGEYGVEPYRTLKAYRKPDPEKDPYFGNILVPFYEKGEQHDKALGELHVGDQVELVERQVGINLFSD